MRSKELIMGVAELTAARDVLQRLTLEVLVDLRDHLVGSSPAAVLASSPLDVEPESEESLDEDDLADLPASSDELTAPELLTQLRRYLGVKGSHADLLARVLELGAARRDQDEE